ncbi:MAG: hypothetical protein JXR70_02370 [Spirochaetales bacterium]|nr:hypothetical protein [Spirochaetales bacterium]
MNKFWLFLVLANCVGFLGGCPVMNPEEIEPEGYDNVLLDKSANLEDDNELYSIPFECTEGICLWWNLNPGVDGYRIYRYTSAHENNLDTSFPDINTSSFVDKTALPNRIYYYRLAFIKAGAITEMTNQFVPAIFSSLGDNFEPNNHYKESWQLEPGEHNALIYKLNEGQIQDSDIYRVRENSGIYSLIITFPEKNPAIKDLRLVYEGLALNLDCCGHEFYIDSSSTPFFKIEFAENHINSDIKISYQIILKPEFPLF